MNKRRQAGFTLIEVMVALMIFAVLSVTLLTRLGDNIRAEHYLETKTIASIVAENVLTEMRLKKEWSAVANKKDTVEMTGIKWQVNIIVTDTPNENFRKVEVQVGPEQASSSTDGHVISLVSYIGQY